MNRFDFVFLIRLCYVDKESSLAKLIVAQRGKLKPRDIARIESILEGETSHKVLLLLDGYDEYKPGTNADVDRAIEHSVGNCFLIVTSRPDLPSNKEQYLSNNIKNSSGGFRGGRTRHVPPPTDQNFFNFIGFFGKYY